MKLSFVKRTVFNTPLYTDLDNHRHLCLRLQQCIPQSVHWKHYRQLTRRPLPWPPKNRIRATVYTQSQQRKKQRPTVYCCSYTIFSFLWLNSLATAAESSLLPKSFNQEVALVATTLKHKVYKLEHLNKGAAESHPAPLFILLIWWQPQAGNNNGKIIKQICELWFHVPADSRFHSRSPCWGTQTPGPHPWAGCASVRPPAGPTGRPGSDQLHTMRSQSKSPSGTKSSHRANGQITETRSRHSFDTQLSSRLDYFCFNEPILKEYLHNSCLQATTKFFCLIWIVKPLLLSNISGNKTIKAVCLKESN